MKAIKQIRIFVIVSVSVYIYLNSSFWEPSHGFIVKISKSLKYNKIDTKKLSDLPVTTYEWFKSMKNQFKDLGEEDRPRYSDEMPLCQLNISTLGLTSVNKTKLKLQWVEEKYPEIRGGFYAPTNCRARHKVAILVSYRDRESNLIIFLNHMHTFLKKQYLEYRIFVIEQHGTGKFNKGSLYNIGFLESQRFGNWHCFIFHDVDLLPLDERILYSCPRTPTHMSPGVESYGYKNPYRKLFGGVTAMTPAQFEAANGYSNVYWGWGAEDDDMFNTFGASNNHNQFHYMAHTCSIQMNSTFINVELCSHALTKLNLAQPSVHDDVNKRSLLQARRYPMIRYNQSIARYAVLPHNQSTPNIYRYYLLSYAKSRFRKEGLSTIEYSLVNATKKKLFVHIVADVNPYNITVY